MGGPIYLTFDDGPAEPTIAILDALAKHDANATFFQQGSYVEPNREMTLRVHERGHAIGNHAWSHQSFFDIDYDLIEAEMSQTSEMLENVTGQPPQLFRPPFGHPWKTERRGPDAAERQAGVQDLAKRLGMTVVLWDFDVADWHTGIPALDRRTPDELANSVIRAVEETGNSSKVVVLLHELVRTAAALPGILRALGEQGYVFESVPAGTTLI